MITRLIKLYGNKYLILAYQREDNNFYITPALSIGWPTKKYKSIEGGFAMALTWLLHNLIIGITTRK